MWRITELLELAWAYRNTKSIVWSKHVGVNVTHVKLSDESIQTITKLDQKHINLTYTPSEPRDHWRKFVALPPPHNPSGFLQGRF